MSSGDNDVGAGPSQPMSDLDNAREANLKFWRLEVDLSGFDEEAEEAAVSGDDSESEYA